MGGSGVVAVTQQVKQHQSQLGNPTPAGAVQVFSWSWRLSGSHRSSSLYGQEVFHYLVDLDEDHARSAKERVDLWPLVLPYLDWPRNQPRSW